ncbi:MAG: sigma-70 family RNA polymerase sigma factor [Proteiniphilum sp.]|jgi:RNA polymerase sigma-70 factor (ECF subfamily)|nr:sigma-70 family RNA polymerase sigma factor [Proteiniphilum sp.]
MKTKDCQLLLQISGKDAKAFNAFYNRYIKMIYRFVFKELNDESLADDLIQDFWLRVWEDPSFLRCSESGSVQVYMLQHLRFRILDLYRKTVTTLLRECTVETAEYELIEYNSVTKDLSVKELVVIIHEALEQQPQIIRNTFWMRINNRTVEETARILSVSHKTVYNRYSESLAVVRSYIREHYPEFAELSDIQADR